MRDNRKKNAFIKNALSTFLSIVFFLAMGMKTTMAQIIYVDQAKSGVSGQSWDDAVPSIAEGIERANATNCTEIWVAKGIYAGQVQLSPGLHLYGSFSGNESTVMGRDLQSNKTTIDAGNVGSAVIGSNGALIDGFVITNGNADKGGGIYCELGELSDYKITVLNCTIEYNTATSENGGGIYVSNYIPEIRNCKIQNNTAAEGAGGGIYCSCPSGVIQNNDITGNISGSDGAGVYGVYIGHDFKIFNNLIAQNYSGHGSGAGLYVADSYDPTISNNIIVENRGVKSGAGFYLSNSNPYLINNTIASNISEAGASNDLVCSFARPIIMNCIIWSDVPGAEALSIQGYSPAEINVTYSDISSNGSLPAFKNGTGNMSNPPAFAVGYFLKTGSSCINAGNPDPAYRDRDGSPNDIGAYGGPNGVKVGVDYDSPSIEPRSGFVAIEAENSQGMTVKFEAVPGSFSGAVEIRYGTIFIAQLSDSDGFPPIWGVEDLKGNILDPKALSLKYGENSLKITATDAYGNKAKQTVSINLVDTTHPDISCPANITIEAEGPDGVPASNSAMQAFLNGAKATDKVDNEPAIANDAPLVFKVGTTDVTFTATDKALNTISCTATVNVGDTTKPVITCPENITVEIVGQKGVPVSDAAIQAFLASVKAVDIADSEVSITNNAPAVFNIGGTTVTFTATDKAMNTVSCTATVTVKMKCCGDVNLDGQLTIADVSAILKCYLETGPCNEYFDVNGDGKVDLRDAQCVLNRYLERPSCLDDTCGSISK